MGDNKLKILFVCVGNSCRSQMAEAWAKNLRSDDIEPYSAGVHPLGYIVPNTIKVMSEVGIDMSDHQSKHIEEFKDTKFDYVVTLCSEADIMCPTFPKGTKVAFAPFEDPLALEHEAKSEGEALRKYRYVRDKIRDFVKKLPDNLNVKEG